MRGDQSKTATTEASVTQDVIIVGAGPAGLALARALAATGLRIAMIERQPADAIADPADDGREIALTHRSVDTLRALGAWHRIDPGAIAPLNAARVLNGGSRFALAFDTQGTREDRLGHLVSNHAIRRALFAAVAEQPDVVIHAGAQVVAASTTKAAATVRLADGRTLHARLLVSADSRFSEVRAQLGIAADVHRLGRSMMVCRVGHQRAHGGIATEWFDYGQTLAMLPLNGRCSSAVLTLPSAEFEALKGLDHAALGAEIARRYRHRLGAMDALDDPHIYPLATTWAHHFAGTRAALIGDAAVGMHPVTAHGFNLGLRGAVALGALVTDAARRGTDIAAPALLRRYERGHRLASRPLFAATNLIVGLYTADRPSAWIARHATLRIAAALPMVRRGVGGMLAQH